MNTDETIQRINQIIQWYNETPYDYSGITELMHQRVQLSTLLFFYAVELGNVRKTWKQSEIQTERIRRCKTKDLIDAGMPNTKAVEMGKFASLDEYAQEKTYDGLYFSMKLFYDSALEVLNTLNQHISNLKKEQEQSVHS